MKLRVDFSAEKTIELVLERLTPGVPAAVEVGGRKVAVTLLGQNGNDLTLEVEGRRYTFRRGETPGGGTVEPGATVVLSHRNRPRRLRVTSELDRVRAEVRPPAAAAGPVTLYSLLPGVVRQVLLEPGHAVEAGTPILTLEAMKMENEICAEVPGRLEEVHVEPGQVVAARQPLARIAPS